MPNPSFGLSRARRLTENTRIREVCRGGKKITSSFATMLFAPNGLSHARLCVAVSKKQVARAVQRNRLKRRVRESFRLQGVPQLPGMDIVVIVYKSCFSFDSCQQREILQQQWQRLARRAPVLESV